MLSQLVHAAERIPGWWRMRPLVMPPLADLHRRRLDGVTFVAVTGSAGKTTTSLLAAAVLETAGRTRPPRQANRLEYVMAAVLATQPSDDFCVVRSEEHTSELQSLMRISYAVFCLKKKKIN